MNPNVSHELTNADNPMDLSEQQIARLYKLTLEVRRALGRDVTPTAILHVIIGYGLTHAEQQGDFARRVPGGRTPALVRGRRGPRRATGNGIREASPKRGSQHDLGRRGQ
jgi:hypothetical protein